MSETIAVSSDELNVQVVDNTVYVTYGALRGERGEKGDQGNPGIQWAKWEGAYSGSKTYQHYIAADPDNDVEGQPGSVVTYGGSSYFLFASASAGTLPTNATKWAPVAVAGTAAPSNLNFVGEWDEDDSYAVDDAVNYEGSLYACTTAVTGTGNDEPPIDTARWALVVSIGPTGLDGTSVVWRGPWSDSGESYAELDAVYDGVTRSSWICTEDHISSSTKKPGTAGGSSFWNQMAGPGANGADGADGVDAVTWWPIWMNNVDGTEKMIVPSPVTFLFNQARVSKPSGAAYTVTVNGVLKDEDGQVTANAGDVIALTFSGVAGYGEAIISVPIIRRS